MSAFMERGKNQKIQHFTVTVSIYPSLALIIMFNEIYLNVIINKFYSDIIYNKNGLRNLSLSFVD